MSPTSPSDDAAFDEDVVYDGGGHEDWPEELGGHDDAGSVAEAYGSAYATYLDARQRLTIQGGQGLLAICCPRRWTSRLIHFSINFDLNWTRKRARQRPWKREEEGQGQGRPTCFAILPRPVSSLRPAWPLGSQLPSERQRQLLTKQQSRQLHAGPTGRDRIVPRAAWLGSP